MQQALTKEQKQAVGILSIGTFLEYFDLMLYVHMAILLNDLFFSKTDTFSASLLSAFSFCATFIFRPIGALLIGWLGDTYGRKSTILLTTAMMSIACILMAALPTYDQIGIFASIAVTVCRVLQGMSSMGERVGAEVYLTEIIKPPKVYPAVASLSICLTLGGTVALFVANLAIAHALNWRVAFWIGAIVAFVGTFARSKLRETPDFADAKRELHKLCNNLKIDKSKLKESLVYTEKLSKRTAISFFLIQLACPVWFYLTFIHCSSVLKDKFGYTIEQVIQQNFIVSSLDILFTIIITYLVIFINPLKFLKIKTLIAFPLIVACPFLLDCVTSGFELMLFQILLLLLLPLDFPATPIFYKSFPVFSRFTTVCFSYATSRAVMYIISSFGIIYLIKYFGNLGLLFLFVPVIIGYGFGLLHFVNLEKKTEVD